MHIDNNIVAVFMLNLDDVILSVDGAVTMHALLTSTKDPPTTTQIPTQTPHKHKKNNRLI